MKITLAITNYENLKNLKKLLPQVSKMGFYNIYVLDDCSGKETINYLRSRKDIRLITSDKRLYPTKNRNRILKEDFGDIILFLDSDMEIISKDMVNKIKQKFIKHQKMAVVSGLILSDSNKPMWWNYGKFLSPFEKERLRVWLEVALKFWNDEEIMKWVIKNTGELNYNFWEPKGKKVDWAAEGFYIVRSNIFKKLSGFDEKFIMYHEGPDFCKRIRDVGGYTFFMPSIKVKHLGINNIKRETRNKLMEKSDVYWYGKHLKISPAVLKRLTGN